MFKKLKDKLKSWTQKVSKEKEVEETIKESKPEDEAETILKETKENLEKEIFEKEEKLKEDIKKEKEKKEDELEEKLLKEKEDLEKLEKKTTKVETPQKFETATQKVEPDTEKIKEVEEKLLKEKENLEKLEKGEISKKITIEEPVPEKTKSIFKKIKESVGSKITINKKEFEKYENELETILLENNVAFEVTEKILEELKEKIVGKELQKKEVESNIQIALSEIINDILVEPFDLVQKIKEKQNEPYVILFCGINGSGKTTTIAKLINYLQKENITSTIAASDTFRAASIEQIKIHGKKLGVEVISHEYGSDPAAVGFDAIKYAKKNNIKCVLIDTAGRMHTAKNLLQEIEKIARVCKPDTKIFLGESITGNDAIEQVKAFDDSMGIDGIILSKADIDEKGGTALSLGYVTKKPILFLGTGQGYDDFEKFDKQKFIKKLDL